MRRFNKKVSSINEGHIENMEVNELIELLKKDPTKQVIRKIYFNKNINNQVKDQLGAALDAYEYGYPGEKEERIETAVKLLSGEENIREGRIIKKFKLFVESYSEDLKEVLDNEENKYIVVKGDNILVGFEYINDCFDYLSEILEGDGAITEEQRYEFMDYVDQSDVNDLMDQYEIDEFMEEILDKFEIVEPYKISKREELEETPVDVNDEIDDDGNNMIDFDELKGESDKDIEDYNKILGESLSNEPYCIVGKINGQEEEIDSFSSEEEANEFLPDYKEIYNEFEDLKIIHRGVNENFPDTNDQERRLAQQDLEDEMAEWANEQDKDTCECMVDGKCTCGDTCTCRDNCECEECKGKKKVNEDWKNTVADIVGIADPSGIVDLANGIDYMRQGQYFYGLLSMISILPYAGDLVAKPMILLAKSGKMKGVTKAMKMVKDGNKKGAVELLKKGADASAQFEKFMKNVSKWAPKLKKVIEKIPVGEIKDDERSTLNEWIDTFIEASGENVLENRIKTFSDFKSI